VSIIELLGVAFAMSRRYAAPAFEGLSHALTLSIGVNRQPPTNQLKTVSDTSIGDQAVVRQK